FSNRYFAIGSALFYKWKHQAKTTAAPNGDQQNSCPGKKHPDVCPEPFRTEEGLVIFCLLAEVTPLIRQLINDSHTAPVSARLKNGGQRSRSRVESCCCHCIFKCVPALRLFTT